MFVYAFGEWHKVAEITANGYWTPDFRFITMTESEAFAATGEVFEFDESVITQELASFA